jgi:hypothetical protein
LTIKRKGIGLIKSYYTDEKNNGKDDISISNGALSERKGTTKSLCIECRLSYMG